MLHKVAANKIGPIRLRIRGSVLVCVLVVLLLVGLLITQTIQTLLVVRRGDAQRRQVQQARELLQLGEMIVERTPDAIPTGERQVLVNATKLTYGSIRFEALGDSQLRIVARFPDDDTSNSTTATEVITLKDIQNETDE